MGLAVWLVPLRAVADSNDCGSLDLFCHLQDFVLWLFCFFVDLFLPGILALVDILPTGGVEAIAALFPYLGIAEEFLAISEAIHLIQVYAKVCILFVCTKLIIKIFVPGVG